MSAYVDSGLLVKLFVPENNSTDVSNLIRQYSPPLPIVALQELEVRNAIRLKLARNEISSPSADAAIRDFEDDLASGLFERKPLLWLNVFAQAETLSVAHHAHTLCRTLDILHVAAAMTLGLTDFLTSDTRQQRLASRIGLTVKRLPSAAVGGQSSLNK